jgi:iron complex outermembrane recepter protein
VTAGCGSSTAPTSGSRARWARRSSPASDPADARSESRNNVAAYVDVESNLTEQFLVNVAGRVENYSDFGSTTDGKVALRFEPVRGYALRGAAGTGFRAPSLGQSHFSSTATNFIGGVPFDIRTFPVNTQEAQVLGARALKPEQSLNFSGGVSLEPIAGLVVTADYFNIFIEDRIVLSENFTGAAVQNLFAQRGLAGVSGGRFFTNAINTRSSGVDVVANYGILLGDAGTLRLTGSYNQNRTRVTRVSSTPPELSAFQEALFSRVERGRIEEGQPRNSVALTLNHTVRGFGVNLHNHRFGEVTQRHPTNTALDQTFSARWITDLDVSYRLPQRLRVAVGANNLLDVYPDEWLDFNRGLESQLTTQGIYRYPGGISPFGFNGRFVYLRLSYGG